MRISGSNIKKFQSFIGRAATVYGGAGIAVGFLTFLMDMATATMMQRFFMSTGLITVGTSMPLGIALQSPYIEGGVLVSLGLLRAATIWGNGFLSGLCQVSVEVEKRQALASWAIAHGGQEIGAVMSYFNDIIIGAAASIGNIFYVLSRLILLSGIFIVMLTYSVQITLFVLLLIAVIAPLQMMMDRIVSRNSKIIQSSLARGVTLLSRAIKNNLFITLHNLTASEVTHIHGAVDDYGRSSINYYSLSSLRAVIPQVLGLASVVLIAIQGRTHFADNPAAMVAFLYMVLRLFQVLSDMARVSGNLRLNYPRISILYKWWFEHIYDRPLVVETLPSGNRELIGWSADHIGYVWSNGHATAIDNLSFDIKAGSTTLIVGPSGAGKTTLFQILLGLLQPTSGQIFLTDVLGIKTSLQGRLAQTISYVGPDPFLVAGTIRDQLLIGNGVIDDAELTYALKKVHADFVFDFAAGLGHTISEQGHGLSAGQKQRLALARAILRQPSVLLLDEATANLDETTERVIIDLVNTLHGKMTILVISHRPHKDLRVDQLIDLKPSIKETITI